MNISEQKFAYFLELNGISFQRVPESTDGVRPDYLVSLGGVDVYFEVKRINEDQNFQLPTDDGYKVSSRTLGEHVRARIRDARKQVRYGFNVGCPSVLLIYNNLDPAHEFGTSDRDFEHGMYGEPAVNVSGTPAQIVDSFHGRDAMLRAEEKRYFSAIGRIGEPMTGKLTVTLFENVHAAIKLPPLPPCFQVVTNEDRLNVC